jgi:hypothetical protein
MRPTNVDPPFVAQPIIGERFVEDVTLQNEVFRKTEGIQKSKGATKRHS